METTISIKPRVKIGETSFKDLKPTDLVWNTRGEVMQLRTAKALLETYRDDNKDIFRYTVKKKISYESTGIEVIFDWLVHEQKLFDKNWNPNE